ncbi:hypothetical protein HH310_21990 [Actinoplanes sp. TBRC 11911]|uniref:hypothetical protein n=1 Tax=Actinoplanes sp. TBRC 11911 TaxID=2729386 RepID=UPI00145EEFAE|nr:hypothetical protein [Actinoplanes sp. TBRC 11911]NMO53841.1 hypothetical protein [Actinoplanes sp. TBRC 11911]
MAGRGNRAWPYRRVRGDLVKASPWTIDPDTDGEREVPDSLPDWDYQTDLRLRRRISLDSAACREVAGLPPDASLAISVRWNALPSLLRGSAAWLPLRDDSQEYLVDVEIEGERLGGIVNLETMLVLAAPDKPRPAVAHLVGSNLWNDQIEIRLQGNAPLFPIAQVPFSESSLPYKAAWFLELGADLNATALGAIQLLVNQEHPTIVAAVGRASSPNDVDRAVLSALRSDVVRTMLERALEDEAFDMTEVFEKDTLGAVLQGLMRTYMSSYMDDGLLEIRRIRASDPPMFATIVQAATDLLADER